MGKDLKNKELGKGIVQRKDGLYTARFVTKTGERKQKYFETVAQARNWLEDARHEDKYSTIAPLIWFRRRLWRMTYRFLPFRI